MNRARGLVMTLTAALFAVSSGSCMSGRTNPEPETSAVLVHNRSVFDVNVYSVLAGGASQVRLGTVVGNSSMRLPLRTHHLQPGDVFVVRLHAIGSTSWWTSNGVTLGEGVIAILDVNTDAFGDCSRSFLHTIVTVDPVPQP